MADLPDYLIDAKAGAVLKVFVQPAAAKDEMVGVHGSALKLKVRAAPEDGKANTAACRLIAKLLDVPPARVTLLSGAASRHKKLRVEGVGASYVVRAIEPLLAGRGGR